MKYWGNINILNSFDSKQNQTTYTQKSRVGPFIIRAASPAADGSRHRDPQPDIRQSSGNPEEEEEEEEGLRRRRKDLGGGGAEKQENTAHRIT